MKTSIIFSGNFTQIRLFNRLTLIHFNPYAFDNNNNSSNRAVSFSLISCKYRIVKSVSSIRINQIIIKTAYVRNPQVSKGFRKTISRGLKLINLNYQSLKMIIYKEIIQFHMLTKSNKTNKTFNIWIWVLQTRIMMKQLTSIKECNF